MKKACFFFSLIFFLASCNHRTPKSSGYFRIDIGEHTYQNFEDKNISFQYSGQSYIEPLKGQEDEWFNIVYPAFRAKIYCSYMHIQAKDFAAISEDNRKFTYQHVLKADDIQMYLYEYPEEKIYGVMYEIQGNVASPIQFSLSDSVSYFFRGSLYFDCTPNQDSIAPVLNYIKGDIIELSRSFRSK